MLITEALAESGLPPWLSSTKKPAPSPLASLPRLTQMHFACSSLSFLSPNDNTCPHRRWRVKFHSYNPICSKLDKKEHWFANRIYVQKSVLEWCVNGSFEITSHFHESFDLKWMNIILTHHSVKLFCFINPSLLSDITRTIIYLHEMSHVRG